MQVKLSSGVNFREAYPAYIVDSIREGESNGMAIVRSSKFTTGHLVVVRESGSTEALLPNCL